MSDNIQNAGIMVGENAQETAPSPAAAETATVSAVATPPDTKALEKQLKKTLYFMNALVGKKLDLSRMDEELESRVRQLDQLRIQESSESCKPDLDKSLEGLHIDSSDVNIRETFVTRSLALLTELDKAMDALLKDREAHDPSNDQELLGLMDQQMFKTPDNSQLKPVDRAKDAAELWRIIDTLGTIVLSPSTRQRFTTLGSILSGRHTTDLYAALIQLAFCPMPKMSSGSPLQQHAPTSPYTTAEKAKLSPATLRARPGATAAPAERSQELLLREKSAKMFHDIFNITEASRSLEALSVLLNASTPSHPTPPWFRAACGRHMSQILLQPGGVRVVLEYMLSGNSMASDTIKLDQLEKMARLVLSVPSQAASMEQYFKGIIPQLLGILEADLQIGFEKPVSSNEGATAHGRQLPPTTQLVHTATFIISRLLAKHPELGQMEIVASEVFPLWMWGTTAGKSPTGSDTIPRADYSNTRTTTGDDDDNDGNVDGGMDPIICSEYDIGKAVLFLHGFLVGNEPSPPLFDAFLNQAALGLYYFYQYATQFRSVLREKAKEILVVYARIMDTSDTVEFLKAVVMRRRPIVSAALKQRLQPLFDKGYIQPLIEMGSAGEAYFAPGPSGGIVLRKRRSVDENAVTQLEMDVDVFLDFMSELEATGEGELAGDIFMYLLNEYQAAKTRGSNAVSPRRMLTMLQLILNMTDKLGPSIMNKLTQIIGLSNNILEQQVVVLERLASKNKEQGDEVANDLRDEEEEEESDLDFLSLVLTLFSAILSENEKLTTQDKHMLGLTLVHLKPLADHPVMEIRRLAHDLLTLIPVRIEDSPAKESRPKTEMELGMEKYASALAALQDQLLPVRAHGLHMLRELILTKSAVFGVPSSIHGQGDSDQPSETGINERELDHALDIFIQHVQEQDSFIYLNAVKGLSALTDAYGAQILKKLMSVYTDKKQDLDTRLKVGEALIQTVQRCGEALGRYTDALLPGLYEVLSTQQETSSSGNDIHAPSQKPTKSRESLKTAEELKAEEDAEAEGGVIDEVSMLRSSALTILATACESSSTALLPQMRYLVDWVLAILDLDQQREVRRAATLVLILLFRAQGGQTLYRVEGDQLKRALRMLRYIEQVDHDPLTRAQARTALADLDDLVRDELGISGGGGSGGGRRRTGGILGGVTLVPSKPDIRYK
ncbi:hypothetical protein DFQ27_003550 [Actinomortierella ambigua]|uniref:RNA polymerase II assembly factor Rtp1 C-terminal domain-containing protein n=1 Tax=Actinomortierella ambigua TaxID=1343610 RepID=A0A9P6QI24_9FUNG|nr:hypothetical protein DFQ27_003550 [Actinomortierella ambigua]